MDRTVEGSVAESAAAIVFSAPAALSDLPLVIQSCVYVPDSI